MPELLIAAPIARAVLPPAVWYEGSILNPLPIFFVDAESCGTRGQKSSTRKNVFALQQQQEARTSAPYYPLFGE